MRAAESVLNRATNLAVEELTALIRKHVHQNTSRATTRLPVELQSSRSVHRRLRHGVPSCPRAEGAYQAGRGDPSSYFVELGWSYMRLKCELQSSRSVPRRLRHGGSGGVAAPPDGSSIPPFPSYKALVRGIGAFVTGCPRVPVPRARTRQVEVIPALILWNSAGPT